MYNPAGFNPSGLGMDPNLGDPRRQENLPGSFATQGQAVSAPYAEANMVAAGNTNPMNAVSQEPGKDFLQGYLQKSGIEQGETAFNIFDLFGGGTKKALEAGDAARRGEGAEYDASRGFVGGMLNRNRALGRYMEAEERNRRNR
jgi:hypothetical protein